MPSKFDQLRAGQAVEIEPGLSGRLNKEKKTLELSSGQILNVGKNKNFFPEDESQLKMSKQREYAEKGAKGPVGEFIHQYTSQGIPGGIGDWPSYLTQTGEDYAQRKAANAQVSERISEQSPYISGAATGANIATDIALTRGMSALKAAPLITLGAAGSRIATEPQEVAAETAASAGLGFGLDKVTGYLGKVAQRRAQSRAIPGQQQQVREANQLGQQSVINANEAQSQQFNILRQNVKNTNEARLKQHQNDLNSRQNNMIQSQNAYEQAKAAREAQIVQMKNQAEVAKAQRSVDAAKLESDYKAAKASAEQEAKRLSDEFKLAKEQYEQSLKQLPVLQKKAQEEFSQNVIKNAQEIERSFPKNSKISTDELGIDQFIGEGIEKTGIAGTPASSQGKRILRSLFPEGELIGGRELSKRYKALEDAIQRSTPEVQQVLNNFKSHLGDRLPNILEDSILHSKVMPLIKRTIEADIRSSINELGLGKEAARITKMATANANNLLKNGILSKNFVTEAQTGEFARNIANKVLTVEDFLVDIAPQNLKTLKKQGLMEYVFKEAERKHAFFVNEMVQKLESKMARYEIKAMQTARNASKKLGKDVKQTYGIAESVPPPSPPVPPSTMAPIPIPGELPPIPPTQIPPPINPPKTPPLPSKPGLIGEPTPPIPQTFMPQPEPTLAPPQGFEERTGDFMEKNLLGGGKSLVDNPITKLAGLKYLLGKAALPAEAAYLGMKGLTSPTALGETARMTFKQAGIQAIESWAQKYPSYHDGILESPQDRRSLTKEIEDASDIPIEQKAVIQSKINEENHFKKGFKTILQKGN